jgi:NitT/TauT family transport system ATP-binding protein
MSEPTVNEKTLIAIKDLDLVYNVRSLRKNEPKTLTALSKINLQIQAGEFFSIVGPSGCGKSTLLYILAGLIKKSQGSILINGHELTGPGLDRGIIMQQYALFPWRSIRKNVEFGLEVKKIPAAERKSIAQNFLALVGLSEFSERYPYELSGGMKQRVAIARALAFDPEVLLMDEPFAAIDEQTRETMHDELLDIWEKTGKTIVFVTHSIDEAVLLADRVAVLSASPGTVKEVVDVALPRPRTSGNIKATPAFARTRRRVWELLHDEHFAHDEKSEATDASTKAKVAVKEAISESAVL